MIDRVSASQDAVLYGWGVTTKPTSFRRSPVDTHHVVTTHAVARMLGWSTARVRSIDRILRPERAADGGRLYDVARVLFFVGVQDVMNSLPPPRLSKRLVPNIRTPRRRST